MKNFINKSIRNLKLELNDLNILTGAASENFVITPLAAAVANAEKI